MQDPARKACLEAQIANYQSMCVCKVGHLFPPQLFATVVLTNKDRPVLLGGLASFISLTNGSKLWDGLPCQTNIPRYTRILTGALRPTRGLPTHVLPPGGGGWIIDNDPQVLCKDRGAISHQPPPPPPPAGSRPLLNVVALLQPRPPSLVL